MKKNEEIKQIKKDAYKMNKKNNYGNKNNIFDRVIK